MDEHEEKVAFRALVLSGIWLILRASHRDHPHHRVWRADAISHMDAIGLQHDEAKAYRRQETFPE